jgi:hypothetical protein
MFTKKVMVSVLFAAGTIGAVVTPLPSMAAVDIQLNFGPPPLRVDPVPVARRGYVWSPGYWDWRGNRHVWVEGFWIAERPGYYYRPHQWVERGGQWYFERGRWDNARGRDSDRDGIPDRRDARPFTPDSPRGRDSDRDGVPDRRDAAPYDPNRR